MKTLLLIALMAFSSLTMNAVSYPTDVTYNLTNAGTLSSLVSTLSERNAVLNLKITGSIDVRDIYYLRTFVNAVSIDLSDANVEGYMCLTDSFDTYWQTYVPYIYNYRGIDNCFKDSINIVPLSNLTTFVIPKSTESIDNAGLNYFVNGTKVTSFTIPETTQNLRGDIFGNGNNITDITTGFLHPERLSFYYDNPFISIDTINCVLHVPYGTKELYQTATYWKSFQHIVENAPNALNVIEATPKISIYPNPCTNSLHINAVGVVEITNMSGAVVKMVDVLENESVDVSDLSKGVYFVKVGESVCKLVKE